jgi:hypothetical protein
MLANTAFVAVLTTEIELARLWETKRRVPSALISRRSARWAKTMVPSVPRFSALMMLSWLVAPVPGCSTYARVSAGFSTTAEGPCAMSMLATTAWARPSTTWSWSVRRLAM